MALVGDPIPPYVKTQIDQRQSFHGSGVYSSRTPEQITYLNSTTSWVKLASGVNVTDTVLTQNNLSPSLKKKGLAEKYVLFGGTSQYNGSGASLTQKDGFDSSYDFTQNRIIPMPGITFADVKTLNRGSIKKSTVKILCHSKEQFAALNLLYMRIGYTVFLEWGNSHYINNSGQLTPVHNTIIEDSFFQLNSDGDYTFIQPKIEDYRQTYCGNYDALLGKVSNFEWNFTGDGWEISLTICSLGDVLESLKTNVSLNSGAVEFLNIFRKDGTYTGTSTDPVEKNKDDNIISSLLFLFRFIDDSNKDPKKSVHIKQTPALGGNDIEVGYFLDVTKFVSGSSPAAGSSGTASGTVVLETKTYVFETWYYDTFSNTYKGSKTEIDVTGISGSATNSIDAQQNKELATFYNNTFKGFTGYTPVTEADAAPYTTGTGATINPLVTNPGVPAKKIEKWTTFGSTPILYSAWSYPKIITTGPYIAPTPVSSTTKIIPHPLKNTPPEVAWRLNTVTPQYYLRFGYLLEYIKNNIVPVVGSSKKSPLIDIDYTTSNSPMYCLPISISVDPRVCQVRNDNFVKSDGEVQQVYHELKEWIDKSNKNKAYAMNIYLNFNFITSCINDNLDEKSDLNLFQFLKAICDGLNKALGGVNNLEPVIDEEFNQIRIIDSTPIPNNYSSPSGTLQLYGYRGTSEISTFVREVSLKTVITPELATMLTVGATNSGYVKGVEATAFKHFNDGLKDRFNDELVPSNPTTSPTEAEDNYEDDFIYWVTLCYGYNGDISADPPTLGELDEGLIKKNISIVTEYYKYLIAKKQSTIQAGSIGFIPFKLTFTMDGISGIKIYNQLSISTDFLPEAYGSTLMFIVIGISHKLQNNEWVTEITASPIPNTSKAAFKPSKSKKQKSNKAKVIIPPAAAVTGGVGNDPIGPGLGTYTYDQLESAAKAKGYKWFTRPNELNIIGIRNSSTGNQVTNLFDDLISVSWIDNSGAKQTRQWAATTDPGRVYSEQKFVDTQAQAAGGTARLKPDQYLNAYARGNHDPQGNGGKPALIQAGNVTVWRDPNLNNIFENITVDTGAGFGINIHRSGVDSSKIEDWSAGCQVFKREADIKDFLNLCDIQSGLYGNKFTYTLITTLDIAP
jgi:hypothetical protein